MIYKYNLVISGTAFFPEKIMSKTQGNFIIDSYFSPNDKKFFNSSDENGYGNMIFFHPLKFSTQESISEYEKGFIEFIGYNYQLFIDNGVEDILIFMEIYFDEGQCNFEIFNKILLKKLAQYGVSLPISIYILQKEEFYEWENEIKREWSAIKGNAN